MTAPAPRSSALEDFADQMRVLQRECAWKREQTHTSLIPYVREEAEEVVEAIESGDPAALCDELGDLLLQVVIHAVIAEEAGDFTLDDVARGVIAKMERRNPHVFGDAVATDTAEVMRLWNAAKAAEKAEKAAAGREGLNRGLGRCTMRQFGACPPSAERGRSHDVRANSPSLGVSRWPRTRAVGSARATPVPRRR